MFAGETLRALTTGGCLVACGQETLLYPAALAALLVEERIAVVELVPAVLRRLLDHVEPATGGPPPLAGIRVLAGGADAWAVHEYRRAVRAVGPGGRVVNSYGVTEATIDNAYFDGDVTHLPAEAPLPIGRPYPGNRLYVLDDRAELMPFGVPGELWIGGAGVAIGYHDRADLTATRFRPDPFAGGPGARMYRTGDRARLRADGVLELLGRLDDQVKLHGHRIELAEVEAALAALPQVGAAAVVLRPDRRGTPRLVGYVTARDPADPPDPTGLRAALAHFLPRHALPTQTVLLDSLPLNPNGKVDRRALPAPPEPQTADDPPTPRTRDQQEMAAVWRQILGHDQIGLDDGFFELGGDSFLALRLIRQVEQTFGVRVALLDLYRHPTITQLVEHLETRRGSVGGPARPDALLHRLTVADGSAAMGTIVCIPYSGGQAVSFEPLAAALPDGWALYAAQFPGRDFSRPDEPSLAFDELVSRCADEITKLPGPIYLYGHCHGAAVTIALANRLQELGSPQSGVAVGAMFPMARMPGRFFDWIYRRFQVDRLVSDRAIQEEVRALGGGLADLQADPAE